MLDSMHMLDVLRERGYTPQDDAPPPEGWFDLVATGPAGQASVRAVLTSEDGCEIHVFNRYGACAWSARFLGAPGTVFDAALQAAEREVYEAAGIGWPCAVCSTVQAAHVIDVRPGGHGYTPWKG